MRLSTKTIEDVVSQVVGNEVLPLVNILKSSNDVSELALAKSLKLEVNAVRNLLYKLYHSNLALFNRKKDDKQGIYCYYWSFNPSRVKYLVVDLKKQHIEKLKDRLLRENSAEYFICADKCIRLDFEQAMSFEFKCPECSQLMNQTDNSTVIKNLSIEIKQLEVELKN